MGQTLDERAQIVGWLETPAILVRELGVEKVRTGFALELGKIIKLSLAGPLHPAASQDFSSHHLFGVLPCYLGWL
jgi:hypothetical protein